MQYCAQDILQCIACNTLQGILHVAMLHSSQRASCRVVLHGKLSTFNFPCKIGAITHLFCLHMSFCMDKYNFEAHNEMKYDKKIL